MKRPLWPLPVFGLIAILAPPVIYAVTSNPMLTAALGTAVGLACSLSCRALDARWQHHKEPEL
mgnify:CR=1 FL=1